MSITAMRQALDALEVATTPLAKDRQEVLRARAALRQAIEQAERIQRAEEAFAAASDEMKGEQAERQEPVAWLTKELMADYLDMVAEAIEDNSSEALRHKAHWMRVRGEE
jgi:hypothetical protein